MDISPSSVKNGLSYDTVELDELELDGVPPLAKIPRFSFHQRTKEARRVGISTNGNGIGIGTSRKRNSFHMNSIVEQLD